MHVDAASMENGEFFVMRMARIVGEEEIREVVLVELPKEFQCSRQGFSVCREGTVHIEEDCVQGLFIAIVKICKSPHIQRIVMDFLFEFFFFDDDGVAGIEFCFLVSSGLCEEAFAVLEMDESDACVYSKSLVVLKVFVGDDCPWFTVAAEPPFFSVE